MGWGKYLLCAVGGVGAIIAAPIVLPAMATIGAAALAAGTTAVAATGGAIASTAVGGAVVGAVTTAGTAVASTAIGSAVVGAATTGAAIAATTTATAVTTTVATIGTAGVAATIGTSLTYAAATAKEGFDNTIEANTLIRKAENNHNNTRIEYDIASDATSNKLENYNIFKLEIYKNTIGPTIDIIKNIQATKESDIDFLDSNNIRDMFLFDEIEKTNNVVSNIVKTLTAIKHGKTIMQTAASGTFVMMSQFGIASTGTAISSLSGAAATNATLAALGGGALSVGGGGMALGSAVLGGVAIVPAALIMSYGFATNSEKRLTEAYNYFRRATDEIEKLNTAILALKAINLRIDELLYTINTFSDFYLNKPFVKLMDVYLRNKNDVGKVNFSNLTASDKNSIVLAVQCAKSLKSVIAVNLIDNKGYPSQESTEFLSALEQKRASMEG